RARPRGGVRAHPRWADRRRRRASGRTMAGGVERPATAQHRRTHGQPGLADHLSAKRSGAGHLPGLRGPVHRAATRMTVVVEAESLTKRFGEVSAVTDLSFALEAGTITGFLGPNGAGKTTTLRMILGLAAPTSGRALVFDHPYAELPRAALRIGAVLEATDFHPGRSGRDHLRMLGQAVDVPDSRADEVLRLVELGDAARRRVKGYSLGMRQRLGLAVALLGEPELLVLDEPANGLDPEGVRWLRDFLRKLASGSRTVLISSHVLAEVAQTGDQVLIINRGRLVVESSLEQLTAQVGGAVRVRTPGVEQLR